MRERLRQREPADDDVDAIAIERRADHVAQQLGTRGREVRRLDHDAVAGRKHLDQRTDRQIEREVPRDDVADHALGLRLNVGATGPEDGRVGLAWLGRHPCRQVLGHVTGAPGDPEDLDQV